MKSAMQELIEWIDPHFIKGEGFTYAGLMKKIESLLEIEKQQIIDAFLNGDSGMFHFNRKEEWTSATEYYNQTFNQ